MESYRVGGVPASDLQQGYMQHERMLGAQRNGNGRYGVSIRVQGIDGHPYVVLNNRDRGSQYGGPEDDEYVDRDTDCSFIDNYDEYDFQGGVEPRIGSPFMEYRSQKQMQFGSTHNGVTEFKESQQSSSTLLNFQKHPELLKPYDPESNTLNLDEYHGLLPRPNSFAETGTPYQGSLPRAQLISHARSSSLDKPSAPEPPARLERVPQVSPPRPQGQPQVKSHPQAQSQTPSQPQSPPVANTPGDPSTCRSPSTLSSSTNSSLERSRREPDVLPLRRHDSSGPVLQTSASSSTNRPLPDEQQQETLYADTINRHQNRRYIPFKPGTGRDIDTGSIPGVDELIHKFDGKDCPQRRGRAGRRNRIDPEDRKRSRSVDSAFPFGLTGDTDNLGQNQSRTIEHVLLPSQLRQQKGGQFQDPFQKENLSNPASPAGGKLNSRGPLQYSSAPGSPQGTAIKGTTSVLGYRRTLSRSSTLPSEGKGEDQEKSARSVKVLTSMTTASLSRSSGSSGKKLSSERDAQATPDILKGQEELSQQTNEETAKQILFNYLKDGSADNDDTTKKKVNLVFEKIQTLKSRAAGSLPGDSKPPDPAAEVTALQEQRDELEKNVAELKNQLEGESKQRSLAEASKKAGADLQVVQGELEKSREECARLREKLSTTEAELHASLEELFQVKMEREQFQTEIRDLQDQLSEMHDELDGAKRAETDSGDKEALLEDMMQLKLDFQEVLLEKEEQEEVLRRRERELTALKGALKEEVATHDLEVDKLREQYEQEICELQTSVEEAKQSNAVVCREKEESEMVRGVAEDRAGRLTQEGERLRRRVQELENEVAKLNRIIDEAKLQESRLTERLGRLEKEKGELEEALAEVKEQEDELLRANRALTTRLEDVQRNLTKLNHDHKDLNERLREEKSQKEQFKKTKNEIEEERRLLDRTVEKLQKEMGDIVEASQSSTHELQLQIDEYKEKNRRELTELQRQLRDKGVELEKSRLTAKKLQEELSHLEDDLRHCKRERDEVLERGKGLEQRVRDLEAEADVKSHGKDDRSRQIKLMEDRIKQLEQDLEEERTNGDLLMDRIDRGREQLEQMRNELLQERAVRQDLECDKIAMERQNKDLKSRVSHLEVSQKSNKEGLVSQLESRVQELEERLEGEERERANLQLMNRKLERKVKEVMMQVDDEHHSLQDQKDQLNLRLKALKRQMDEAEEEIDRLEHGKKKLQRDLDEQLEVNDQLQGQLKALRSEMRRKNAPVPLLNSLDDDDDDDISTDGEIYYSSTSGYRRSSQDPIA
ncbi:cingulin-like protein 1 isoform X2 [Conger conger]|uniref:cingulin-like protein 1 isoform X2 n=1 Tax=Conger conger TaxID=82655 RepID=UPI002A5A2DA2|nr:cingulin-like protein 1 isoform X2 [Conger conger]